MTLIVAIAFPDFFLDHQSNVRAVVIGTFLLVLGFVSSAWIVLQLRQPDFSIAQYQPMLVSWSAAVVGCLLALAINYKGGVAHLLSLDVTRAVGLSAIVSFGAMSAFSLAYEYWARWMDRR